ncbi:MAG TPA: hypothetical protein VEL09_07530 [Burkholderiales bacterium]|nr:hypothetical protein [Burkholderiales bacterium]
MEIQIRDVVIMQLETVGHFDDKPIARFRELLSQSIETELDHLHKAVEEARAKPEASRIEQQMVASFMDDESYFLEEAQELADSLSISALYSRLEITIKRLCRIGISGTKSRGLFKFEKIADRFLTVGVDLKNLPEYQTIDELRCLNNAIKHEGKAGPELTKYGWRVGDPIKGISDSYSRFENGCRLFVDSLREELIRVQP